MSPVIQSPAPTFTVTALVDGAFKQVSLSDYIGQWYTIFHSIPSSFAVSDVSKFRVILMFYPL